MEYYMPNPNPNPKHKNTLATILAIIIIALVSYMLFSCTSNTTNYANHYCDWGDCPHQGENMDQHNFISKWKGGYDELTDGWCVEMTHFMNPTWTYEQCEDYVFSGVE